MPGLVGLNFFCSYALFWSRNGARCIATTTFSFNILVIHSMSCNTIYHTPGGDAPRSAGMWWGPLDIIPQISIFRALYDPKKRANSPGYHFKAKRLCWNQGCTNCGILASWLLENGERMRKRERFTPYISSFSLYFLPLYPFPISKIVTFCGKMLNTVLLSRVSQKHLTYPLWENKIIWDECSTGHQESF